MSRKKIAVAMFVGGILLNVADAYFSGNWKSSLGIGPSTPDATNLATKLNNFLPIPLGTSLAIGGAVLYFA